MNIMSFGYLGCSGETLRIVDIDNNDLRVCELVFPGTWHLVHMINLMEHLNSILLELVMIVISVVTTLVLVHI